MKKLVGWKIIHEGPEPISWKLKSKNKRWRLLLGQVETVKFQEDSAYLYQRYIVSFMVSWLCILTNWSCATSCNKYAARKGNLYHLGYVKICTEPVMLHRMFSMICVNVFTLRYIQNCWIWASCISTRSNHCIHQGCSLLQMR